MSSAVSEEFSRSNNRSIRTTKNHPKITLANRTPDTPANPQSTEILPESGQSVDEISTYIIWSVFNLLFIPFGMLCCYFSHKVNQYKLQNRYIIALKWSKRTFVVNIITTLLMFGVIITVVMLRYDYHQRYPAVILNQTRTTGAYIPWQPGR